MANVGKKGQTHGPLGGGDHAFSALDAALDSPTTPEDEVSRPAKVNEPS